MSIYPDYPRGRIFDTCHAFDVLCPQDRPWDSPYFDLIQKRDWFVFPHLWEDLQMVVW